jgi:Cu+-exporting ATPase
MARPLLFPVASSGGASPARVLLRVRGMHCAACAASIERELSKTPGVQAASVNFATSQAAIEVAASADQQNMASLAQDAIEKLGFRVAAQNETLGSSDAQVVTPRFPILAIALTVPVVIIAMAHGSITFLDAPWAMILQIVLTCVVLGVCGGALIVRGLRAIARARPTMESLVAIGALASVLASFYALASQVRTQGFAHLHHAPVYFEAACVMLTFVLVGKTIEARTLHGLTSGFDALRGALPSQLLRIEVSGTKVVPASEVQTGDILLVRAHERVPVDGIIVQGQSELDTSTLTGEARPVFVQEGARVQSGSMNLQGELHVQASSTPSESTLAQIIESTQRAQTSKAPLARTAERISAWFVPAAIAAAILTGAVWLAFGTAHQALTHALNVLLIACPCALGLATPTAILAFQSLAVKRGLLFRSAASIEALAGVSRIVLDKTGTLTLGAPVVTHVDVLHAKYTLASIAPLVYALQHASTHPIARGLRAWAAQQIASSDQPSTNAHASHAPLAKRVKLLAGKGTEGLIDGQIVRMGSSAWLASVVGGANTLSIGEALHAATSPDDASHRFTENGRTTQDDHQDTIVLLSLGHELLAKFVLHDTLRADAPAAIARLRTLAIAPVLATGDRKDPALRVAREVGIDDVRSDLSPEDKLAIVRERPNTAMVGDGVNDAPALAGAAAGIAIAHDGNDLATTAADVIVMSRRDGASISRVVDACEIARGTVRTIRFNLACAFGYNLLALPLACGALEPVLGLGLTPMIASAAMALSSISIVTSSATAPRRLKLSQMATS